MIQPWSERQRLALRAFRHAVVDRARREREVAEESRTRQSGAERHYAEEKDRVASEYVAARAAAVVRADQARQSLHERQEREREKYRRDGKKKRAKHTEDYKDAKGSLDAEFRDSRWTTVTVYDADKRVAKEQMYEAMNSAKAVLKKLLSQWRVGRALIEKLEFLDEVPDLDPKEIQVGAGDPWAQLQTCADQGAADLHALQTMRSPHFINGYLPWLFLIATIVVLAIPGVLVWYFTWDWRWFLAAAAAGLAWPVGSWQINRARRKTNDRIIAIWLSLRHAAHLARKLRPSCFRLAKKAYLEKKRQSFKRNRDLLRSIVSSTRVKLKELRVQRDKTIKTHDRAYRKGLAEQAQRHSHEAQEIDVQFRRDQQEATDRRDVEGKLVESEFSARREQNQQWYTQQWTALLQDWRSACDQLAQAFRGVAREAERWFGSLDRPLVLPKTLPAGLPIGTCRWSLADFPDGVPEDPQLPRPEIEKIPCRAFLPFPQSASLLYRAFDEGKSAAIDALQALLLRCWTAIPAGKIRCTIIDPVGRGENFSAFMHLADHDEKLVDGRIWTETLQIDERLTNLTLHLENVLQKYLRNQYATLAEYNAQAGEVAEPFHFLVVAHFPVNFSEDAARRLVSLASAGARCGIYTFVVVDTKLPMPHGFNLADLENVCTILDWQRVPGADSVNAKISGRFAWQDDDFSMFPLTLEHSPPADRCTELLRQVGEEAVRASKVEVPFEWIMPPLDAWWTAESAAGLRVPIGRFGAQGKQFLELGQGTSQHVLVAGKTGSGKSTLLHVLISQLAMFYSPREVELYLIDFKKGVEFKAYASMSLPHARVIAVESEREFGLSVLQRLDVELSTRGELYRTAGVNDLASFREYARKNKLPYLPRIMLIVDEFQEFFIEEDKIAGESSLLMDRLVRQGRAFGIHVLLGSQTIGGSYSLARSTIDQMAVRIALQCSEADAHLILSRENTEARLLSRPGEAIYNSMHGLLEGNHLFQIVWLNDNKRDEILKTLRDMSRQREEYLTPIVFEGSAPAEMAQNQLLRNAWREPVKPMSTWTAWLGDAVAIKDPTAAIFRKQSGSNVMILGQQEELAISLLLASVIGLSAQADPALPEPTIHLVIGQALDAVSEALVNQLAQVLPIRLWPQRELGAMLNHLAEEIDQRGAMGGPPHFLFIYGLHRLRDLRRPDDDFGYSKKGEEKTPFRQFTHVLKEGPPVGVFTVLWCDTLANLQRSIDRPTMREFDQRILMQMSSADSSTLMDNPAAAKLGPQRALFYAEDQGTIEKFRPYSLPDVEWVRSLTQERARRLGEVDVV
ncbi:MAG: cell division protein FtsK [Planctomycetes bacterium]|nr:cell division protein FtsK [Planctomycetota bacterium]